MKRTLKKSMSILLAFTLLFGSFAFGFSDVNFADFAVKAEAAETFTEGYYTYTVDDEGNATITDVDTSISGDVTIPASLGGYKVTSIGDYAFQYCDSLTSVTIPDSVTSIGDCAFSSCGLTNIVLPDSVTIIGDYAFNGCYDLANITIPDSVTSIGGRAFAFCESLTSITIPGSVISMGDYAFEHCINLTSVKISDGVKSIGASAFWGCENLTNVTIPDSVESIDGAPFIKCTSLKSISVDSDNPEYSSDEFGVLFNKDKTELIQYPAGNTRISYVIPESVISIGGCAFGYCNYLHDIKIGKNVEKIGYQAFRWSDNISNIEIPDSVEIIDEFAFADCTLLSNVTIGNGIKRIGSAAFSNTAIMRDAKKQGNDVGLYISGCFIGSFYTSALEQYSVKAGTRLIADAAFSGSENLIHVKIPGSVENIGYSAFAACPNLTSVEIEDGVKNIGDKVFWMCESLTSITIPDSVMKIGSDILLDTALYENQENWENDVLYVGNHLISVNLTLSGAYKIKEGTKVIADDAFMSCSKLTSIEIPDSVTSISDGAFAGCTSLTSVTIPDSVTSIDNSAFILCYGLTNITIGNSVEFIRDSAFYYCLGLTDVYYNGTEGDWNKIIIEKNNDSLLNATIHFNEVVEDESTTDSNVTESITKPTETKPSTTVPTKPTEVPTTKPMVEHTTAPTTKPIETTKPTTTEPVEVPTTKPVVTEPSTTKSDIEPTTTKPIITEPSTTKPVEESTTKPVVEEEIIKNPSTTEVKYGETLILHADFENIPEGTVIEWSVEGEGVTIKPSEDGKTCAVTSTATGDVTITAKYVDANGVEHVSEQEIESNASFWQKIVSFFKNLFGINRIIEQRIKF